MPNQCEGTPENASRILGFLQEALEPDAGLVLVGGAVRDRLLGRGGGDWDLATALLPEAVMARAKKAGLRVIPTGLQHGTVTVLLEGRPVEITTYRGDGTYLDGRRPESVRLGVALEEDLARRDFTVNAMALPIEAMGRSDWREHLVDPFGGQADLEAGLLRAVGDPLARFQEDGLRPLRACRFAAQLGFGMEPGTLAAIPQRLEVAQKVSVERVFQEMNKLLCGKDAPVGLRLLERSGLLDLWMPELRPLVGCVQNRYHDLDAWEHTLAVVAAIPAEPVLRWAALLHDLGKPGSRSLGPDGAAHFFGHEALSVRLAGNLLGRLKISRALLEAVLGLVRHHGQRPSAQWGNAACRRLLARLEGDKVPLDTWAELRRADIRGRKEPSEAMQQEFETELQRIRQLAETKPPLVARDLALNGTELMDRLARPGGPWLGQLQAHLLDQVLEHPAVNNPEDLARLASEWLASEALRARE
ncbi:MAG: HD domain-containing protein [Holophaga sp.]|nr:HD domain-containing protein [Holophaga sp.]